MPWQGVPIADARIASAAAWNAKEGGIVAGTTGQYWRGDKSWQTLDKNAVGLGNVDNTADASKPVSTATQAALDGKADADGGNIADAAAFQRATRGLGFNKITDEGHELWRLNQFLNRQQHGVGIDARNRVKSVSIGDSVHCDIGNQLSNFFGYGGADTNLQQWTKEAASTPADSSDSNYASWPAGIFDRFDLWTRTANGFVRHLDAGFTGDTYPQIPAQYLPAICRP